MKNRRCFSMNAILSYLVTVSPILFGVLVWNRLPEQVALHFNFQGEPDSYYSRPFAVFGMFGFLLLMQLFLAIKMENGELETKGIPNSVYDLLVWLVPVISVFVSIVIYAHALGYKVNVPFAGMLVIGLLFLILGNYAPKVRRNMVVGARTRWTLISKKNWAHTNRFSGWVLCLVGLLMIGLAFFNMVIPMSETAMIIFFMIVIFGGGISMTVYSYLYHKKHENDADYYPEKEEE